MVQRRVCLREVRDWHNNRPAENASILKNDHSSETFREASLSLRERM